MTPVIISYYTKNTVYEKEMEGLIETCDELGLQYDIEGISDLGSWEANCNFKPSFILKKLKELKRPVLWVDCDTAILKKPQEFDCDISFGINEKLDAKDPSKIFAGTVFINYTAKSLSFLKAWIERIALEMQKKQPIDLIEQESLRDLFFLQKDLKIDPLPKGYWFIFDDLSSDLSPDEIFIVHFQASRLRFFLSDDIRDAPIFYKNVNTFELKLLRQKIKSPLVIKKTAIETYLDLLKQRKIK